MTKKILLALVVLIIAVIGYLAIKEGNFNKSVLMSQNITVEAKKSFDSTGFGAVQLVDHTGKEYYCNLINAEKCNYGYNDTVAMKLVAIPAQGSVFGGWLSGCDGITTTNLNNDTCEVNVYESNRAVEVRFTVI